MLRRRILVACSLALLVGASVAYHVLFVDDAIPPDSTLSIDWSQVRSLAGPVEAGPRAIQSDVVARGSFYGWMVCAGCGWDEVPMEFRTFNLVYANGESIVIDAVHDAERHAAMPMMRDYDPRAFERQSEALRRAERILLTHEHWDHANGLRAVIGEPAVRERMWIPQAQRGSAAMREAGLWEEELAGIPPLAGTRDLAKDSSQDASPAAAVDDPEYHAIAPGVVVIPMPGHTPGSQVVYVRRSDGVEYLFLGDIVWNARNLRERRGKSRLISWVAGEARGPLLDQIAYFADLATSDPERPSSWNFVVAHDPEQSARLVAGGFIEAVVNPVEAPPEGAAGVTQVPEP